MRELDAVSVVGHSREQDQQVPLRTVFCLPQMPILCKLRASAGALPTWNVPGVPWRAMLDERRPAPIAAAGARRELASFMLRETSGTVIVRWMWQSPLIRHSPSHDMTLRRGYGAPLNALQAPRYDVAGTRSGRSQSGAAEGGGGVIQQHLTNILNHVYSA